MSEDYYNKSINILNEEKKLIISNYEKTAKKELVFSKYTMLLSNNILNKVFSNKLYLTILFERLNVYYSFESYNSLNDNKVINDIELNYIKYNNSITKLSSNYEYINLLNLQKFEFFIILNLFKSNYVNSLMYIDTYISEFELFVNNKEEIDSIKDIVYEKIIFIVYVLLKLYDYYKIKSQEYLFKIIFNSSYSFIYNNSDSNCYYNIKFNYIVYLFKLKIYLSINTSLTEYKNFNAMNKNNLEIDKDNILFKKYGNVNNNKRLNLNYYFNKIECIYIKNNNYLKNIKNFYLEIEFYIIKSNYYCNLLSSYIVNKNEEIDLNIIKDVEIFNTYFKNILEKYNVKKYIDDTILCNELLNILKNKTKFMSKTLIDINANYNSNYTNETYLVFINILKEYYNEDYNATYKLLKDMSYLLIKNSFIKLDANKSLLLSLIELKYISTIIDKNYCTDYQSFIKYSKILLNIINQNYNSLNTKEAIYFINKLIKYLDKIDKEQNNIGLKHIENLKNNLDGTIKNIILTNNLLLYFYSNFLNFDNTEFFIIYKDIFDSICE